NTLLPLPYEKIPTRIQFDAKRADKTPAALLWQYIVTGSVEIATQTQTSEKVQNQLHLTHKLVRVQTVLLFGPACQGKTRLMLQLGHEININNDFSGVVPYAAIYILARELDNLLEGENGITKEKIILAALRSFDRMNGTNCITEDQLKF